jgi:hypothetical protein
MNVEIGIEVTQFPKKEYINGIFFTVWELGRVEEKGIFVIFL